MNLYVKSEKSKYFICIFDSKAINLEEKQQAATNKEFKTKACTASFNQG